MTINQPGAPTPGEKFLNKQVIAWAFYDWGNSAFALSVLAVFFPLFLGAYWSAGDPGTRLINSHGFP